MITVRLFRKSGKWQGFSSEGHAGYAESGYDIICAAVSVLTINTVNSIESIADDQVEAYEEDGFLECSFPNGLSEIGEAFVESMLLGLNMTAETTDGDGMPFLKIMIEEV